jgi:citrate synthase
MAGSGLEGVVAAATQLSHVDGERGELLIAGYQVDQLAERVSFEEATWLDERTRGREPAPRLPTD